MKNMEIQTIEKNEIIDLKHWLQEISRQQGDDVDYTYDGFEYERMVADGDVEIHAFAVDSDGLDQSELAGVHFEVFVSSDAEWHEGLGAYRDEALSDGGPIYKSLSDELSQAVADVCGCHPTFVKEKGHGAFKTTVYFE